MTHRFFITAVTVLLACASSAGAQTVDTQSLNLAGARMVMSAALDYAESIGAPGGTIAVVDNGGHLIMLERLDGTFAASADVSIGKARTAALFRFPTRRLEAAINDGRTTMVALTAVTPFTPLQGGVPLVLDDAIVGAIGVSGAASAQQDDEIAQAAADSFAANANRAGAVEFVPERAVAAAFEHGAALVESSTFKVNASRRDEPGEAEIHLADTDIFYVRDGAATIVTGGEVVDGRSTGSAEIRGVGIRGGEERALAAGDVIVIPKGTPHWFKTVSVPMTYYVVKSSG